MSGMSSIQQTIGAFGQECIWFVTIAYGILQIISKIPAISDEAVALWQGVRRGRLPGARRSQTTGVTDMSILDKILGVLLAVAVAVGLGALWYADHEHSRARVQQQQLASVAIAASQAAADRDAAIQAASDAQAQLRAAEKAVATAQASAAAAASAAIVARDKLNDIAHSNPDIAKTLNTQLPKALWDAIYNQTGK